MENKLLYMQNIARTDQQKDFVQSGNSKCLEWLPFLLSQKETVIQRNR
jgi:hypothetical protein